MRKAPTGWILATSLLAATGTAAQDDWTWPEQGQNLQSLPKDFSGSRLRAVMTGFTRALGLEAPQIMQMDGICGAATAVMEMLAHERAGTVHLAPAVPEEWGDVSFEGIRLPDGTFARGTRENGTWTELTAAVGHFAGLVAVRLAGRRHGVRIRVSGCR